MSNGTTSTFRICLENLSPLLIGGKDDPMSGREKSTVSFGNHPIIPGPSLKGALRAAMEDYLITKYYDSDKKEWKKGLEALRPCIPNPKPSAAENGIINSGRYRKEACSYSGKQAKEICPVCYFLGAQGLVGFVNVPFLISESNQVQELYSLRIDRGTGAGPTKGSQGGNRPYKVVRPGIKFYGDLKILNHDHVRNWDLGKPRILCGNVCPDNWLRDKKIWENVWPNASEPDMISLLKSLLESIQIIGGYKSKGCGRVKITVTDIK